MTRTHVRAVALFGFSWEVATNSAAKAKIALGSPRKKKLIEKECYAHLPGGVMVIVSVEQVEEFYS